MVVSVRCPRVARAAGLARRQERGQEALTEYYQDDEFVRKFGQAMQEYQQRKMAAAGAQAPPAAQAAPEEYFEINDIFDAAKAGDVEAIEDFAATNVDMNGVDEEGRTALHLAVAYDKLEATRVLINEGCNVNATDKGGNTPLVYAAGYGRREPLLLLLRSGAAAKKVNAKGQTALDIATADERNPLTKDEEVLTKLKEAVAAAGAFTDQ